MGTYRDLELTFEATTGREAAQQAFDQLHLHPDEEFPELLIVPDDQVHMFSRDDAGRAITTDEDMGRRLAKGPATCIVTFRPDELRTLERD